MKTLLGIAATCLMAMGTLAGAEPGTFRVLTYNIHHAEGTDGKLDLDRIAEVIRRAEPDVVMLQEVDMGVGRSGRAQQATELGKKLGMTAHFGKAIPLDNGEYGNCLLTKQPLTNPKAHKLASPPGRETRVAVAAQVAISDAIPAVQVISLHLDHQKEDVRLSQLNDLKELIGTLPDTPMVLAGDFNAVPGSPTIARVLEDWHDSGDKNAAPTIPSSKPRSRIDYVFTRNAPDWRVIEHRTLAEPVASDHVPVLVVFATGK